MKLDMSKLQSVFVQIANWIYPNVKLDLSKFETGFVQIANFICIRKEEVRGALVAGGFTGLRDGIFLALLTNSDTASSS